MLPWVSPSRLIRFKRFEVDLKAGELRKDGLKIKLQEQPFRVLAVLLEHASDIVTREELRQRLWPNDVFLDFDQGLNKAINKIREALGDSADSPQFIETLPKRGYRFVAPVNGHTDLLVSSHAATQDDGQARLNSDCQPGVEDHQPPRGTFSFTTTAVVAAMLLFFGYRMLFPHEKTDHQGR